MYRPEFYKKYIGKKYGKLTIIERLGSVAVGKKDGHTTSVFRCRCECGNSKNVKLQHLRNGHVKSCGCFKRNGVNNPNWQGYKQMSRHKFNVIKKGAEIRNLSFNISIENCMDLFEKQGGICALSGLDITINKTASLDRIDSSKGYEIDNIQWVHKDINQLKWAFEETYLKKLCSKVANFSGVDKSIKIRHTYNKFLFNKSWKGADLSLID